jgi:hypothetical protein
MKVEMKKSESCYMTKIKSDEKGLFVDYVKRAIEAGNQALINFRTTGDRSKFKEWSEKYGDQSGCGDGRRERDEPQV